MSAQDYLNDLRNEHRLTRRAFSAVGKGAGAGTNLECPPDWLVKQIRSLGTPPNLDLLDSLEWIFTHNDWAQRIYEDAVRMIPENECTAVTAGPTFAIGSRPNPRIGADVISVPPQRGSGIVVLFDFGLFVFLNSTISLAVTQFNTRDKQLLAKSAMAAADHDEHWALETLRILRLRLTTSPRSKIHPGILAMEYFGLFDSYTSLGICTTTPIPSLAYGALYPQSVGLHQESVPYLQKWMLTFVMLHELSHVILGHEKKDGLASKDQELAADRQAMRYLCDALKDRPNALMIGYVAASMFFEIVSNLECLEMNEDRERYPSASERQKAIKETLMSGMFNLGVTDKSRIDQIAQSVQQSMKSLWTRSSYSQEQRRNGDADSWFGVLLSLAASEGDSSKFIDQVARFFIFSSPTKLCREIAFYKASIELARSSHGRENQKHDDEKLRLIGIVLDMLSECGWAADEVQAYYEDFCRRNYGH